MPLATGQKALKAARLGVARLGVMRLGYYQPWIKVMVAGQNRSSTTRMAECSITDELNFEPNVATILVSGFTPTKGQVVEIYMGDTTTTNRIFGGRILTTTQGYEAQRPLRVVWRCKCIDYTWILNCRKVIKKYTNQSATAIVIDLITSFTAGFTTVNVAAGLATIDEITFTNEDVTDALTRIAERIGAYWYVDYSADLHFFLSESVTAASITTSSPRGMSDISQDIDLSPVATRVTARGGGSSASSDVNISSTTLPIDDATWYPTGGGIVEVGQQRITYTGVAGTNEAGSTTGYIGAPPASFTVGPDGNVGSMDPSAVYGYALTYVSAEGETVPSATVSGSSSATGCAAVNSIPVPTDPKITSKNLYRTDGGGSTLKKRGTIGVAQTSLAPDNASDASLTTAPPTANTAGFSSEAVAAGATSLQVEDLSVFPASGWADVGGQVFSYTGRSASSGSGTLTGIPASGVGSLTSPVRAGTVKAIPHLTGCTGIVYAINQGDPVNIVVTVNDATAQTAMAGFIGGDGVVEQFLSDGRWSSTEATARANAELTQRKDPLVTVRFKSRDQTLQSGRDITITLSSPSISGTFKIQRVTFSELGLSGPKGWTFPLRTVEASSRRYSFEDLLRQLKKATQ